MAELTWEAAVALFDRRRAAWLAEDVEGYLACFAADLVITVPGRAGADPGPRPYERLVRRSFAWARPRSFDFHHVAVGPDGIGAGRVDDQHRNGGTTGACRRGGA